MAGGCASFKISDNDARKVVVRAAKDMIGKKYRFGETDRHTGFDCSGLSQYAYSEAGIKIPRTAKEQYQAAKKISRENLNEGDLVFFSTNGPGASHVGIYCGKNEFIHAPSQGKNIRKDNMENSYWKKNFYGAGNFFR